MSQLINLGKAELCGKGANFLLVPVPVFLVDNHPPLKKMVSVGFDTIEKAVEFIKTNMPLAVFDSSGVYGTKYNVAVNGPTDRYNLRYCQLTPSEVVKIKTNIADPAFVMYTFKWDFSCWFGG